MVFKGCDDGAWADLEEPISVPPGTGSAGLGDPQTPSLVQPDKAPPSRRSTNRRTRSRQHAMTSSPIRILIVDNYEVIRQGIRAILQPALDIEVVGEASDADEAIRLVRLLAPDVVIMEVFLRGANGPTVAAKILRILPSTHVVALSGALDVTWIGDMIRAGATGYLTRDDTGGHFCDAIRAVAAGQIEFAPEVAELMTSAMSGDIPSDALSVRERAVLGLVGKGLTNKEIARSLVISEKTVKTHVSHIIAKLGVKTRTQAALLEQQTRWASARSWPNRHELDVTA
jgi:NarL family two-component system response regulator LiaR